MDKTTICKEALDENALILSAIYFLILLKDVQINFIDRKDFGGHEKEHLMVIDDSWLLSLINYSMGSHTCVSVS